MAKAEERDEAACFLVLCIFSFESFCDELRSENPRMLVSDFIFFGYLEIITICCGFDCLMTNFVLKTLECLFLFWISSSLWF